MHNPRFHSSSQALGGLAEISASPFLALSGPFTGGAGIALAGAAVMHGTDHLITGAQTAFTSRPRHTVTSQMLQKTGMSPEAAQTTDSLVGITATFGGAAAFNAARVSTFSTVRLPSARLGSFTAEATSRTPVNPLRGTRYSRKVLSQMENSLITGRPDFHGFPRMVDNYASLGERGLIGGQDGLSRLKISLEGSYCGRTGQFEWIIETDKSVNHRLFVPKN